jgi:glyoxylase-like metal-dependent hydrolase (beta-lactamase superfamily II)
MTHMKIRRFVCNAFQENAYVVSDGAECIIIDPGFTDSEAGAVFDYISSEGLVPSAVLLTHRHPDHILGLDSFLGKYDVPVLPAAGAGLAGRFQIIKTPGHTPDSVCFYNEQEHIMFTGDTLFAGTIGRTDLPGGDYDSEIRSIMEKLIFLPGETTIYPGHGPESTIARERVQNPFLEPFNEREELDLD